MDMQTLLCSLSVHQQMHYMQQTQYLFVLLLKLYVRAASTLCTRAAAPYLNPAARS
jgi:hypothetical protein